MMDIFAKFWELKHNLLIMYLLQLLSNECCFSYVLSFTVILNIIISEWCTVMAVHHERSGVEQEGRACRGASYEVPQSKPGKPHDLLLYTVSPPVCLQAYCPLFLPFCEQGTPQLTLLLKMQEYCYINMSFMKSFHKIVLLFYKSMSFVSLFKTVFTFDVSCLLDDVITEQAILKWYNESHLQKGKSVFLQQMKPMVDWLMTAEEESDSETVPITDDANT